MEDNVTTMDANVPPHTSLSALSSGGVVFTQAVANNVDIVSSLVQPQQPTPAVTVEYLNHPQPEPAGEILDTTTTTENYSSPPPSMDGERSPPPRLTAPGDDQHIEAPPSEQKAPSPIDADASGSSPSNGSSAGLNPIASDHCYGLPYQDHNYGTASAQSANRNSNVNGNGSNGNSGSNNGANYSSGSQRHPSGSHRLSISGSGTGSPAQGSRLSSGGTTPIGGGGVMITNRRLNFYPNGNGSKPPPLSQYGPTVSASHDSRASPSIGTYALDRTSFSDDDGSVTRTDVYGLSSPGLVAPVLSPAAGNSGTSPASTPSYASTIPSSPGIVLGQSGITVTTSGQVRGRLRSIGVRPLAQEAGHSYHSTPAIHPRLAPPNPTRSGVGLNLPPSSSHPSEYYRNPGRTLTTSNTIGSSFNSVGGPPILQRQQHQFPRHPMMKLPSAPPASNFPTFSRQGLSTSMHSITLPAVNGGGQVPPPKKPGRPKGARPGNQQPMQPVSMSTPGGSSGAPKANNRRGRKLPQSMQALSSVNGPPPGIYATGMRQPPGTPFSPSGLMTGQPPLLANRTTAQQSGAATSASASSVDTILEAVAAGLTAPSSMPLPLLPSSQYHPGSMQHSPATYHPTINPQQRSAHSSAVHEAIGGPLAVGTSPIIPAHPMFANAAASVAVSVGLMGGSGIMNSQRQHQSLSVMAPTQEKFMAAPSKSTTASSSTTPLGLEGFREVYNSRMSALFAQVGLSDKDDDTKPKPKSPQKSSPYSKKEPSTALFSEAKGKSRGRQKKLKVEDSGVANAEVAAKGQKAESPDRQKSAMEKVNNGKMSDDDGHSASSDEDSSVDEWEGKDYTTRCLCEMEHNDEFMIQCDLCEVWQHCECMGLDTKNIPDNYLCERCDPRPLKISRAEAQRLQHAKVSQWKRKKAAAAAAARRRRLAIAKRASMSSGSSAIAGGRGRPRKSIEASNSTGSRKRTISSGDGNASKRFKASPALATEAFTETTKNVCTTKVAKAIRTFGDTVGAANLLSQLPLEPLCKFMYVAAGRHGLVATATVLPDLPIIEYRGRVCWSTDFEVPDGNGGRGPVVAPYLLYYRSGGADGSDVFSICVDARFTGTSARFVRRSCQPNSQVKHVVCKGVLHLLLVSTELIECGAEITIPFDFDISKCNIALECACSTAPLVTSNMECPVVRHNKSLPPPGLLPAAETNGGGVEQFQSTPLPVKRRPGRPPGSGKANRQQNRGNIATSATTAAARKKSKKARGFKVQIVGKKKQTVFSANIRGGKFKGAAAKMKLRQHERVGKKFKPTATADLTKRRFSEESRESKIGSNGGDPMAGKAAASTSAPGQIQKHGSAKVGRSKSIASPGSTVDQQSSQQHLSREERKMQSLMEQISRMEQREQKKAEKKLAKMHVDDDAKPVKKSVKLSITATAAAKNVKGAEMVGRSKSATMDRTTASARRKRTGSEAAGVAGGAKRPRLWSESGETSSSISSMESEEGDVKGVTNQFGQQRLGMRDVGGGSETLSLLRATSALSDLKQKFPGNTSALSTSPPLQQPKATAGDVAKKRWLRQAMSEDASKNVGGIPAANAAMVVHVDTKIVSDINTPMQISPSSAAAPPKKRIIQEFSNTMTAGLGDHLLTATNYQPANESGNREEPISTVEAAQLLAELHQKQVIVPKQSSIEPTCSGSEWKPEQQPHPVSALKMIYPEELPPPVIQPSLPLSANVLSVLATTIAPENFMSSSYFTSPMASTGGAAQGEILSSYPATTTGLLYSAIEDNIPTVPFASIVDGSLTTPEVLQQVQKKKVKMSIDEYKKRKRESVNEVTPTTPNADSADESPTSTSGSTPTTSTGQATSQRPPSFIPQIKDADVANHNLRLSSVPDPESIGKSSATLDDLRKRIYNRTFGRKPTKSTDVQQESATAASQSPAASAPVDAASTTTTVNSNSVKEPSTPPRDATSVQNNESLEESPEVHRLSLMDRLRIEFGLD